MDTCYSGHLFWAPREYFWQNLPLNSWHPMIGLENRKLMHGTFLYFNIKLIIYFFQAIFHHCYNFCITFTRKWWFVRNLETKLPQFSGTCPTSCRRSRSIRRRARDSNRWRWITAAEALKKLNKVNNFIEVNGSDYLNMIFNEFIENVEQMKLKNQKQCDIRSFFRPYNLFYIYRFLV